MLASGAAQPRRDDGAPTARHEAWKPHPMQGWSPDFVPKITGDAVAEKLIDTLMAIPGPDAMKWSQQLAQKEGIFCGITSGATFAAAIKTAEQAAPGSNILAMLPDTGERYLTTILFEGVNEGSDDEWLASLDA